MRFMPKRWWKRILLGACLSLLTAAGIYFAGRQIEIARGEAELKEVMAELDRAEPRWRFEQWMEDRPKLADDQNAVMVGERIMSIRREAGKTRGRDTFFVSIAEFDKTETNRLFPPHLTQEIQTDLRQLKDAIPILHELRNLDQGAGIFEPTPEMFTMTIPQTQNFRFVFALAQYDAYRHLLENHPEQALDSIGLCLKGVRVLEHEPLVITTLVRVAGRMIAVRTLERTIALTRSDVGLGMIRRQVLDALNVNILHAGLFSERACLSKGFENMAAGKVRVFKLATDHEPNSMFDHWSEFDLVSKVAKNHAAYLRMLSGWIELSKRSPHEWVQLASKIPQIPKDRENVLAYSFSSGLEITVRAVLRSIAAVESAQIAVAVEEFRQKNRRWPAALAELGDGFTIPIDPFDGSPMRYRILEDRVVIYSVGPDQKDDGGMEIDCNGKPGTDIGFRLWNLDQRRLPAAFDEGPHP